MADPWRDLSRPPLRASGLRRALTEGPAPDWRRLDVVDETGSTNADLAVRAAAGEAEGAVLVADHQIAGRGRRDRTWTSPPRAGLAVSVLFRPAEHRVPPEQWSWLTLMAAVAVTDVLTRFCGLPATVKWPNDVLVEDLKVAGLLAEVVRPTAGAGAGAAVVLGIGLNVSQDAGELPVPTATSLRLAGSAVTDCDPVLRAVLRALAARYRAFVEPDRPGGGVRGIAAVYRERCSTVGRDVRVHRPDGTTITGLADGIDDEGRLLVRPFVAEGEGPAVLVLSAGDVVHIRPAEPA
jgi:BirA family transcriptional regulator, biotin operon repressor / biotin---[acetyl-CoA-carboxylase] ligase